MLKGVYGCIKKERDYHRIKKKKNYHATPIPPHHKRSLSELRILGSHLLAHSLQQMLLATVIPSSTAITILQHFGTPIVQSGVEHRG